MLKLHQRPTLPRRTALLAGSAGILALAACAEEVTEPTIRQVPDRANALQLTSQTWVTARFVHENNNPAPYMYIHVTPYRGTTWTMGDSEVWKDVDPRVGFVKRLFPSAPSYTGCLVGTHGYYVYEEGTCNYAMQVNGTADRVSAGEASLRDGHGYSVGPERVRFSETRPGAAAANKPVLTVWPGARVLMLTRIGPDANEAKRPEAS